MHSTHPRRHANPITDFSDVVDAIGTAQFESQVLGFLRSICLPDHFAAFCIGGDELVPVAAASGAAFPSSRADLERYVGSRWWRQDPAIDEGQHAIGSGKVIHVDLSSRDYLELRPAVFPAVGDRLLFCDRREEPYFISVIRMASSPAFTAAEFEQLNSAGRSLVAACARHRRLTSGQLDVPRLLRSLHAIEACISHSRQLPKREAMVCARVVYGMSTAGISLDLGLSEQTVKTYRKRAYQRLDIGTERDLIVWFLALATAVHRESVRFMH